MHASWRLHSADNKHSGRQLGGAPMNPDKQEQAGWPPMTWHRELGPQGDGEQDGGRSVVICVCSVIKFFLGNNISSIFWKNLRILVHWVNGSPVYPRLQAQTGLWFLTLHWASIPHVFGQGSTHFWFRQAFSTGHSLLPINRLRVILRVKFRFMSE